ncbi:MAG: hypothetical protein MJZ25_04100 [Fibrobacter sp.]|nr:hypothetical protein [Fibrobacter sp.]
MTNEQLFIYKVNKLKTEENAPIVEGIIKAFGMINGIDTELTESQKIMCESIETLEAARGDQNPKAFFESISMTALQNASTENISDVRHGLNEYKNWLSSNPNNALIESDTLFDAYERLGKPDLTPNNSDTPVIDLQQSVAGVRDDINAVLDLIATDKNISDVTLHIQNIKQSLDHLKATATEYYGKSQPTFEGTNEQSDTTTDEQNLIDHLKSLNKSEITIDDIPEKYHDLLLQKINQSTNQ